MRVKCHPPKGEGWIASHTWDLSSTIFSISMNCYSTNRLVDKEMEFRYNYSTSRLVE